MSATHYIDRGVRHYNDVAHDFLYSVCEELGVKPQQVREIRFGRNEISVDVYDLNEEGKKFMNTERVFISRHTEVLHFHFFDRENPLFKHDEG